MPSGFIPERIESPIINVRDGDCSWLVPGLFSLSFWFSFLDLDLLDFEFVPFVSLLLGTFWCLLTCSDCGCCTGSFVPRTSRYVGVPGETIAISSPMIVGIINCYCFWLIFFIYVILISFFLLCIFALFNKLAHDFIYFIDLGLQCFCDIPQNINSPFNIHHCWLTVWVLFKVRYGFRKVCWRPG